MRYLLLLLSIFSTSLFAKHYTNCTFQNLHHSDICKKVVKRGVSYDYANKFLLSYFKTQKFDEVSWKYLKPKYVQYHKHKERKANNVLVSRVPNIVKNINKHQKAYDYAEKKYAVNKEIIAAILLKETNLGKIKPTHDAFIVFNTIVTRLPKPETSREKWLLKMGKTNMATIIEYCYKNKLAPEKCNLPSSYAGAIGIPQFMPNSFIYAESYKNKVPDLTDMDDAIVSVAKFLHKKAGFDTLIDWKKMDNVPQIEQEWYQYEFDNENTSFAYEKNSKTGKPYNYFCSDKPELDYLKEYMKKILRYNNSSNYAIGVLRLAHDASLLLAK
ncbi:lytic murein transglycosylase [Sulfurimonas sp. C5]|uniref:lytic murein transglycosylase n=1 Tax=Sulfurimonas sp. C5 TaxID=3036947 RepID=UPI00245611D6|nr:lytic murein transglycosylase [Sulfurimonas sp. C5]MDH4944318.1 lytic murein transglycosylase [Sulfurimonas sp. C5]